MLRGRPRPLREELELGCRQLRAVVLRGDHPVLQSLLAAPILPDAAVALYGACALQFLTPSVPEPLALASILDEEPHALLAPNVRNHPHAFHGLGDGHGAHLREVFRIRMPYGEACMHSCVDADVESMQRAEEQLNKLLDDYATYAQRRQKIEEDAQKAISRLQEKNTSGQYDANIAEVKRKEQEALNALDVEIASREDAFSAWMNKIADFTLEKLKKVLKEVKEALSEAEKNGTSDEELANARAKVVAAEQAISKAQTETKVGPNKRTIKEWEDLQSTLRDVAKEFKDMGNAVGGTLGNIISAAGQISTSAVTMINSISQLGKSSIETIGDVTGEVESAIQKAEKSSVILTIISAAIKVIQGIASLFSDTETSMERNIRLAKEFNEELRVMNERARLNSDAFSTIFGDDAFGNYRNNVNELNRALDTYQKTLEGIRTRELDPLTKIILKLTGLPSEFKTAMDSIASMGVEVGKSGFPSSTKYKSLKELAPELFRDGELQMEALKKFAESNNSIFQGLNKTNQALIKQLVADWETYENALKAVSDYLTELFGDLGQTLSDALVDAFANGTDAAKTFTDSVSKMLERLAQEMIYSVTLAPVFKKAQEEMAAAMGDASLSKEEKFTQYVEILDKVTQDALAQQGNFDALLEKYQEIAKKHGYDIFTPEQTEQQATSKGFQTMSQDTGDELNGRFTVMTDIMAKSKDIQQNIMGATFDIRDLAMAANNHLQMISRNTAVLSDMNARLKVIEENTGYLK